MTCATAALVAIVASTAGVDAASEPFEWGGTFATDESSYAWTASMKTTKYADATMKLALIATNGTTGAHLETAEAFADTLLEGNCTDVSPYTSTLTPSTTTCYRLVFDSSVYSSIFKMNLASVSSVAIFTEHAPTEFERKTHYLIDEDGHDVEPVAQHNGPAAPAVTPATVAVHIEKDWGGMLLGCLIVNLCTLIGVIALAPCINKMLTTGDATEKFNAMSSSFAAGALIATAVFLMLPEGQLLVKSGYKGEVAAAWRTGTVILAGFLVGIVVDIVTTWVLENKTTTIAPVGKPDEEKPAINSADIKVDAAGVRTTVAILVGDALHNFADGIFVGAAFKTCGASMGWAVVGASVAHEVTQELADYFVLTGVGGMSTKSALLCNFLSGLSVVLGGIIVFSMDVADSTVGLILCFGAGAYLYIAGAECIPRAFHADKLSAKVKAMSGVCFVLGAICIGLVLLNHSHCEAPMVAVAGAVAAVDPHAGHGHGR